MLFALVLMCGVLNSLFLEALRSSNTLIIKLKTVGLNWLV